MAAALELKRKTTGIPVLAAAFHAAFGLMLLAMDRLARRLR